MSKGITAEGSLTIGLDLGDKYSEACVLEGSGEVLESFGVRTSQAALDRALARFGTARVVLEVGTHSPWVSRRLARQGHEVIVANPRRVRLIAENDSKSDRFDAELLARLGRVDPALLSPIVHRGEEAQRHLVLLRARDGLVRARTQLINQVRGFAKSLGSRLPSSSSEAFPKRVREAVGEDLFPGLDAMLRMIEQLTREIRSMDQQVERLCQDRYGETEVLRQIPGVGPLTALAFVLTLEDPTASRRVATSGRTWACGRGRGTREGSVRSCGSPRPATRWSGACSSPRRTTSWVPSARTRT
jgi:transposase